jgi:hypothetical protein
VWVQIWVQWVHDLDQFFDERKERLKKKQDQVDKESRKAAEGRERDEADASLVSQRGASEYRRLKDEVRSIARRYKDHGFEIEGERISNQGYQALFSPGSLANEPLHNPSVTFGTLTTEAVGTSTKKYVALQLVPVGQDLKWKANVLPEVKSTSELATWIITELAKRAEGPL